MILRRLMLAVALVMIAAAVAWGAEFPRIEAKDLKKIIDTHKKVVIVDARSLMEYDQGHVPGAISVGPDRYTSIAEYLPKDKTAALIFYCRGIGCVLSTEAATEATKAGYKNIRIMSGGFPEWKSKGYPVAQ